MMQSGMIERLLPMVCIATGTSRSQARKQNSVCTWPPPTAPHSNEELLYMLFVKIASVIDQGYEGARRRSCRAYMVYVYHDTRKHPSVITHVISGLPA